MWADRYIDLAAKTAGALDRRHYRVGAVGIRGDGAVVASRNGAVRIPFPRVNRPNPYPPAHAEMRLLRKLDRGAEVFVVRLLDSGRLGVSRPCKHCMKGLRQWAVRRVWYWDGKTIAREVP